MMYKRYLNTSLIAISLFIAIIAVSAEGDYPKDVLYDDRSGYRWLRLLGPAEGKETDTVHFGSYLGEKNDYYNVDGEATSPEGPVSKATAIPEVTESSRMSIFNGAFYRKISAAALLATEKTKTSFHSRLLIVTGLVAGFILLLFIWVMFQKILKKRRTSQETDIEARVTPSNKKVTFNSVSTKIYIQPETCKISIEEEQPLRKKRIVKPRDSIKKFPMTGPRQKEALIF